MISRQFLFTATDTAPPVVLETLTTVVRRTVLTMAVTVAASRLPPDRRTLRTVVVLATVFVARARTPTVIDVYGNPC